MRRRGARAAVAAAAATAALAFAAPAASAAPWQCDAYGYLFQAPSGNPPGMVQQIDLATGAYSTLGETADVLNAVGYNPLDDYFYAWDTTTRTIVKVEDDLTLTPVPSGTFPGLTLIGDFDDRGRYWALSGTTIYAIDYAPGSPRYGQVVATVPLGPAAPEIINGGADWTWTGGYLYMIGNDADGRGHLLRIDTATGTRTDLTPAGFGSGIPAVGATYADANGYVYGSVNASGDIYRVDPRTGEAILLSTAAPASSNDGARCASAPIPTVTVRKVVDGRVRTADQFTVSLVDPGGRAVASATTAGAATSAATVDWPVSQFATYTITDAMATGSPTPIGEYPKSIACVDRSGNAVGTGGTPGAWTLLVANATDYDCVVTNRASADLAIVKTASTSPAIPGESLTYTLRATNDGPTIAAGVTIADPLPAGLVFTSASPGCTFAAGTVTCDVGELAVGATRTFTVTTAVPADMPAGTLENTATVRGETPDPDPSDNRSTTRTPVEPLADLAIVKRALSNRPVPGRQLGYELTVTSDGPSVARDVRVSDPLPRGLSFVSASEGCAFADGTVTCTAASLDPGGKLTFRVVTRVASSFTGRVTNTATVESTTRDPDPSDNRDREDVPSGAQADLSIVKIPAADRVTVGGQLFYTLLVRNAGPSDARDVVVSDVAGSGLTLLSAEASQGGPCEVSPGTVTCRLGTVATGGTAQVLVSARAEQVGELSNRAKVTSPTDDPDRDDNRDERRVTGEPGPPPPAADLSIVKTANRRAVVGKRAIAYTLRVRNDGPGAAPNVQVTDTPSLAVAVRSVRASVGSCVKGLPVRCSLGTLAPGATATIRVVAVPKAAGTLRNSASVTSDVPDPDVGDNIDRTSTKVRGLLKVKKVARAKAVRAGGTLTYKIRVTNASAFALRSVRVCDRLPSGLVFAGAKPKAKLSKGKRCWTIRTLGAGKSKTLTLKARVLKGAGGRKVNVATATAPNARGARSRAATGRAAIRVLPTQARGGGVTG